MSRERQKLQHAGLLPDARNAGDDERDNTPANAPTFADLSTPSPNHRHAGRAPPMNPMAASRVQGGKSNFMSSDQFLSMNSTQVNMIGHDTGATPRRRRRPNVEAMLRSSVVSDRLSRYSSMTYNPSLSGPQAASDVVSVPILGDCAFDQKYTIAISQDDHTEFTPMAKLQALRDVMGGMTNKQGYIDRATFSQAFEDQVVQLLTANFSSAKIEVVGTDFKTIATLLFRKANVRDGTMSFDQFKYVFHTYVGGGSSSSTKKEEGKMVGSPAFPHHSPMRAQPRKSKFHTWYEANELRIWWLLFYFVCNNLAFWLKFFHYKVDPALGWGLRIARGCAQVCMLNALFVLLPMCRSITQVMKRSHLLWKYIPFDDHIEFHKICGTTLLVAGLVHTGAHVSNEINLYLVATPDEIGRSIFVERDVPGFEEGMPPPFTTMLQALPVWTGVLLLLITAVSFPLAAIPKFRQGRFNLFWYSHMLFGPFLLILCFHGAASWLAHSSSYLWAGPPFAIYLIERRFRYAKMFAAPVRIMEARELDGVCALFMEKPKRFVYRPGMYLFINCPSISTHEWHPFTISSAPGDNYVSIHVRKAGDWTGALHRLIADCHENKAEYPDVYLDGPVGSPTQDYHRYKTVICVAGGIGVTPFASILKDVVHLWEEYRCINCNHVRHPSTFKIQKLYFHWATRGQESLGWFEETINQISKMDRNNVIETHQYLSTVKGGESTSQLQMFQQFVHEQTGQDFVSGLKAKSGQLTHFGRPDWDRVFQEAAVKHPGEEIGVFFCGPHALEKILDEMCRKYSSGAPGGTVFDYHSEKFA
ncbi:hypothetical protein PybrP1_000701 [[Pythium] brassicae (nom. inval.)]|nr:hypothetical protein PybrP1_000701 [[Pythium] brassicae (nom. inval.)]